MTSLFSLTFLILVITKHDSRRPVFSRCAGQTLFFRLMYRVHPNYLSEVFSGMNVTRGGLSKDKNMDGKFTSSFFVFNVFVWSEPYLPNMLVF